MRISKIIFPLVIIISLSSCMKKISHEEFLEAANSSIGHRYKKANTHYKAYDKKEGLSAEEELSFTLKDDNEWYRCNYYSLDNESSSFSNEVILLLEMKPKNISVEEEFKTIEKNAKNSYPDASIEYNIIYATKPCAVEAVFEMRYTNNDLESYGKLKYDYKFDVYCNLIYYGYEYYGEETYKRENTTKSIVDEGYKTLSVSYND